MKALLLCAGLGTRLRPLTDKIPKPLLEVGGKSLLARHLENLAAAGFRQVIINTAYLADQIEAAVGNGSRWGLQIRISREGRAPLETGGAMRHALPLLGPEPFAVINSDIICAYPLADLQCRQPSHCHLVLVANPAHNPAGDFSLTGQQLHNLPALTYSGIGVFHPQLVAGRVAQAFSVVPLIRQAADQGLASGELWEGNWLDIGTPGRLDQARQLLQA